MVVCDAMAMLMMVMVMVMRDNDISDVVVVEKCFGIMMRWSQTICWIW